jgi:UDP-N-acetyl-2-amino-2-deoxyglucuronate dehydrogenase
MDSVTPRGVAIIGLGSVAEPHLIAYQKLDCVRVIGVVEPRPDRRAEIVGRYGVRGFDNVEALLAQGSPDIACILTPASTHRTLTELCAGARCHILCEKPMAVTLEDALAMKSACEVANVQFLYGSSYRYLPAIQKARSLIAEDTIGTVRMIIEQAIGGQGAAAYRPLSSAHYPTGGPGGGGYGLVDHGIHMLDVFPWLSGSRVTSVFGQGDRTGQTPRPECVILTMANGANGIILYDGSTWPTDLPWEGVFSAGRSWIDNRGWMGPTGEWERGAGSIRVYGTQGALRIFHYANKLFRVGPDGSREYTLPAHTTPWHFGAQMKAFCNNLDRNELPATAASEGIQALRVLLSVYESQESGRRQDV